MLQLHLSPELWRLTSPAGDLACPEANRVISPLDECYNGSVGVGT